MATPLKTTVVRRMDMCLHCHDGPEGSPGRTPRWSIDSGPRSGRVIPQPARRTTSSFFEESHIPICTVVRPTNALLPDLRVGRPDRPPRPYGESSRFVTEPAWVRGGGSGRQMEPFLLAPLSAQSGRC